MIRIRVSQIRSELTPRFFSAETYWLQEQLSRALANEDWGGNIDDLLVLVVSHSSDRDENIDVANRSSRVFSYSDFNDGKKRKCIKLAIAVDLLEIQELSQSAAREMLVNKLKAKMNYLPRSIPKGFRKEKLRKTIEEFDWLEACT